MNIHLCPGATISKRDRETIIEIWTWISNHIAYDNAMLIVIVACIGMSMASLDC